MKQSIFPLILVMLISSCSTRSTPIVDGSYVDSLINNYTLSEMAIANQGDLAFWSQRMDSLPDNFVNGPKYAAALAVRFHLFGNIHDLQKADSLIRQANLANQEKEDGLLYTLANFATLQHHFKQAGDYTRKAIQAGDNIYAGKMASFDADFELGQYDVAGNIINTLKPRDTYPYFFRRSKFEHFNGRIDSAIVYMLKAVEKAADNKYLAQVAISNAADLYIHQGDLNESYRLFRESIRYGDAGFHSMMGIGWIALVHDHNVTLAAKIFRFAHRHLASPDPLLKLMQVAEATGDTLNQKKWAALFASQATQPEYGGMYNKYLIDLYTGILNSPRKAVELALKETENRLTPQTCAWYAWSLLKNNEKEKARAVYKQYISGRSLEGPELYYMGKLMQSLGKGYNAREFFKAAYQNRYDLSPAHVKDLELQR